MGSLPRVNVLLAAYNGEKYIRQQIESIRQQTYSNIYLYIRDDGSKDGTVQILQEYEKEERITVIYGENLGHTPSFMNLLDYNNEAEYYAYSDQDDVWLPDKIEKAVQQLQKRKKDIPVLYFSNYDYYNADMEYIKTGNNKILKPSFANSLVEPLALGFTQVFNKKAREILRMEVEYPVYGHDWWTYMICAGMGEVIYDSTPRVKYRRHAQNVSFGGAGFWQKQRKRIQKYLKNNQFKDMKNQYSNMLEVCGNQMGTLDEELLKAFSADKGLNTKLIKVFYPKRYRQTVLDEILVRLLFILGKL